MRTKKLLRLIAKRGGVLIRQNGSHKVFRLPDGTTLCVPHSGSHLEVSPGLAARVAKALGGKESEDDRRQEGNRS